MNRHAWRRLRPPPPSLGDARAFAELAKRPTDLAGEIRRILSRHRRSLAAVCAGLAVAAGLGSASKPPARTVVVIAAARDLPASATLTAADLRAVALPTDAVPSGAITVARDAIGRTTSGPLRDGEPLTDVQLDDGQLARPATGLVAAPVRLADAQAAQLLRPGERVDVLAAAARPDAAVADAATVVAADVAVVALPGEAPPGAANEPGNVIDPTQGALVVLATTPEQARVIAQAQATARLSAVVVG